MSVVHTARSIVSPPVSIPRVLALTWLPRVAFVVAIALATNGACGSGGCGGCPGSTPPPPPPPPTDAARADAPPSDAPGNLAISIAAPPTASNCDARSGNDAAITGMSITLERVIGGCEPLTFTRTRGTTRTTYTVDCSAPTVTSCIERDETLSASGVVPQGYVIHVRGLRQARVCWRHDSAIVVPPGGALRMRLDLSRVPGC